MYWVHVVVLLISSYVVYVCSDTVVVSLENAEPNCVCDDTNACIRKCCDPNYINPGEIANCTYVGTDEFAFEIKRGILNANPKICYKYGIMHCKDDLSFYRLDPNADEIDSFEIRSDGKLWTTELKELYDSDEYCLENFEDIGVSAYLCARNDDDSGSVYSLGMIVSLPFLFVTFLVHVLLPVKTIHTKCLIGFVLSLFFGYLTLVIIGFYTNYDLRICFVIGMICVFSFMTSFLWTNAMSFDIWYTFSGRTRGFGRERQKAERKRFIGYFIYTYTLGTLTTLIIISQSLWGDPKTWYNPLFAVDKCWFHDNMGVLLYFYGPLATILIINVVFFGLTAWQIRKTQKETAVLRQGENKSHSDDEQRFKVFLKLLLAMGGNWSLEVISFIWDWQIGDVSVILTYMVDLCNVLYGVVIFFLFTFKRTHWLQLQKRYGFLRKIKLPQLCERKKQKVEEAPLA